MVLPHWHGWPYEPLSLPSSCLSWDVSQSITTRWIHPLKRLVYLSPPFSRLIRRIFDLSSNFITWPYIGCPIKWLLLPMVIRVCGKTKITKKDWFLQMEPVLNFYYLKKFYRTPIIIFHSYILLCHYHRYWQYDIAWYIKHPIWTPPKTSGIYHTRE